MQTPCHNPNKYKWLLNYKVRFFSFEEVYMLQQKWQFCKDNSSSTNPFKKKQQILVFYEV